MCGTLPLGLGSIPHARKRSLHFPECKGKVSFFTPSLPNRCMLSVNFDGTTFQHFLQHRFQKSRGYTTESCVKSLCEKMLKCPFKEAAVCDCLSTRPVPTQTQRSEPSERCEVTHHGHWRAALAFTVHSLPARPTTVCPTFSTQQYESHFPDLIFMIHNSCFRSNV